MWRAKSVGVTWLWRLSALLWILSSLAQSQPLLDIEQALCDSANKARQQASVGPVVLDPVLSQVARTHSEEMLSQGYFSHTSPNEMCRTVNDRLKLCNRFCLSSAENLHKCVGYPLAALADLAMASWMDSPSHRRNMISGRFNRVGIGIANLGETYVFTQILSYEPVIVQSLEVALEPEGYRVRLSALVTDGAKEGGIFLDGKRLLNWHAGADGLFSAEMLLPKAGLLEIGQLVGVREWSIETEIPIPRPTAPLHQMKEELVP